MTIRIVDLHIYPLKSGHRHDVPSVELETNGLRGNRRWMIVDAETGRFLNQIKVPRLACLNPVVDQHGLTLRGPGLRQASIAIPRLKWNKGATLEATIWNDKCQVIDQGEEAATWLSEYCCRAVRLVYMPDDVIRPSRRLDPGQTVGVGFDDAYPILLTSLASLRAVNERVGERFQMTRLRANFVVDGDELPPFDEDFWREFTINDVHFRGARPCDRCAVIDVGQETGERYNQRLLEALSFRREHGDSGNPLFGLYVNHLSLGQVRLGDEVTVTKRGPRPPT